MWYEICIMQHYVTWKPASCYTMWCSPSKDWQSTLRRLLDSNPGLLFHNLVSLPMSHHCSLKSHHWRNLHHAALCDMKICISCIMWNENLHRAALCDMKSASCCIMWHENLYLASQCDARICIRLHYLIYVGCFRKCLFGIPRNTELYTELTLFRLVPHNFLLYTAKFRGFTYRLVYMEFIIPSNENLNIKKIKKSTKEWYMLRIPVKVRVYGIPCTFQFLLCWIVLKN
jgi:hypothetical protein